MHNRDDENEVGLDRVKDTVRENARKAPPDVFFDDPPASRRFENPRNRLLYRLDESERERGLALG
jgi:hypothetical protein